MERRKFLIGMGSLAAGSAAAMGTGAFTQASATRAVNATVAADENAFLRLTADAESLDNGHYATGTNDGQLVLQFNSSADVAAGAGGEGLNADAEYYFDNVFQVENFGDDQIRVNIDKSNMDNPDAFTFYWGYRSTGEPNNVLSRDSNLPVGTSPGDGINIGVKIETPDEMPEGTWEDGTIEIIGSDKSEVEQGNEI
jgi:hypothetical protein